MRLKEKSNQQGFLLMEIILALAVAVCAIAGAGLMAFSGQILAVDSELNAKARGLAQELLERQRILAADDFRLANSSSTDEGIFHIQTKIAPFDHFVKSAAAKASWSLDGRNMETEISTLIADYNATAGDDTCDSEPAGDWAAPEIKKEIDLSIFAPSASSTYAIGGIDVYKGKLYAAIAKTGTKTDATVFIFDIANPYSPVLEYTFDNNSNGKFGFGDLAVHEDRIYLAANYAANFSSCVLGPNCAQLQIFDLNTHVLTNFKISGTGDGAAAESVFYDKGYVYLGLSKNSGPEFAVVNVADPAAPIYVSGFEIDAGVNDLYVKNGNAYLAHPADLSSGVESGREQLTILNINDPANPFRAGGFYGAGGLGGNGKSLQVIGNRIYLGRTTSHISGPADPIPDFFVLENSDPIADPVLSGLRAFEQVASANGVLIRKNLAFVLRTADLKIFDIGAAANIADFAAIGLPALAGEDFEPAFDCEGNNVFIGSNKNDKGYLAVVSAP